MIADLLKSKAGVVVMFVVFCGIFFGLSRFKHRKTTRPPEASGGPAAAGAVTGSAVESAASLRRVQEKARARAEDAQKLKKAEESATESYDEAGDAYVRRPVPEPLARDLVPERGTTSVSARNEFRPVTRLRIHGRPPEIASRARDTVHGAAVAAGELAGAVAAAAQSHGPRAAAKVPERFVPFGHLIKAELVITIESTQDEMPLVGLVVEPVYNNGRLVIPAGTELHSMARPDRIRDRIVSTTQWRLIFPREGQKPNGRQLTFEGMALDREDGDGNGLTWGITDGSYGLRGRALRNSQVSEVLMLFAAEALKAAGSSLMDRQQTVLGEQVQSNARNASVAGSQAVLGHFAAGIAKEIERNGVYIQVPAGKQFYVYPRQVIDADRADIPGNVATVQ